MKFNEYSLKFRECQREGGAHRRKDVHLVAGCEYHFDVPAGEGLVFEECLAACAAGCYGLCELLSVGAACRDGYRSEAGVGMAGVGVVACGAFGTGA